MNFKKKSLILSIFLIVIIQILLLINNRQKTYFRYLIWNIQDISIGRLICASFISGLLMSYIVNKTVNNNIKSIPRKEEDYEPNADDDYLLNIEDNNERNEIPPERDLRETQPTISVNYRVIKNTEENKLNDINKTSNDSKYQDDWSNNDSEW